MANQPTNLSPRRSKWRILLLVFFLLLLYIVVPRIHNFSDSFDVLRDAQMSRVAIATGFVVATYVCAAGMYQFLAVKKLRFQRTLSVQVASAFANRLLPAGLGGLTLNVQYLRKSKHTLPQALAVAGTNNILGLFGHLLLFAVVVLIAGSDLWKRFDAPHVSAGWWMVAAGVALVAVVVILRSSRTYAHEARTAIVSYIASYRAQPLRFVLALACSLLLTSCYVAALYFCLSSVAPDFSLWNTFIVFTVGIIAGTFTPTPGGLGGAEAGLVAAFVAYGVTPSAALAAVLLFRLLTYWLPLIPGFLFFLAIERKYT